MCARRSHKATLLTQPSACARASHNSCIPTQIPHRLHTRVPTDPRCSTFSTHASPCVQQRHGVAGVHTARLQAVDVNGVRRPEGRRRTAWRRQLGAHSQGPRFYRAGVSQGQTSCMRPARVPGLSRLPTRVCSLQQQALRLRPGLD